MEFYFKNNNIYNGTIPYAPFYMLFKTIEGKQNHRPSMTTKKLINHPHWWRIHTSPLKKIFKDVLLVLFCKVPSFKKQFWFIAKVATIKRKGV